MPVCVSVCVCEEEKLEERLTPAHVCALCCAERHCEVFFWLPITMQWVENSWLPCKILHNLLFIRQQIYKQMQVLTDNETAF